jgi:hypothetical protein
MRSDKQTHLLLELSAARRLGAGEVEEVEVDMSSSAYLPSALLQFTVKTHVLIAEYSATAASRFDRSSGDTSIWGGLAVTTRMMSSAAAGAV